MPNCPSNTDARARGAVRRRAASRERAVRRPGRGGSASSASRRRGTRRVPDAIEPAIPSALRRRLGVEAGEPRDAPRRAPKTPQIAVGWKPRAWKRARRGHADPADDLVAGDDRGEQLAPARRRRASAAANAAGRDHGRDVRDRVRVRVVEVEAVAEHRVRERGVRRRAAARRARSRSPGLAAELRHRRAALVADADRVRGEPAAERVEHVELRVLDHLRGTSSRSSDVAKRGDRLGCGHSHRPVVVGAGERALRPRARRACRP